MTPVRLRSSSKTSAEEVLAIDLAGACLPFVRQFRYAKGRNLTADFMVEHCKALICTQRVLVEVQGGVYTKKAHGSVTGVLADIDRLNAATVNGWRMLRFTPKQVDEGEAIPVIEAALKERTDGARS